MTAADVDRIPGGHVPALSGAAAEGRPGLGWIAGIIPLAAFANAVAYVAYAGNPLVASDAWYFLGAFLEKAMETGPVLEDFFVKRAGSDHAQPFVKLLLWLNAEWFRLDFVLEAIVGLVFAALMFLVLWRSVPVGRDRWTSVLGLGALALSLVTLNTGMVFNWSLVTMTYLVYFLAVLLYAAAWRVVATGSGIPWLLASAILVAFGMDDVGLIVALSVAIATMAAALKLERWSGAARVLAVVAVAELCYFGFSRVFLSGSPGVVDTPLANAGLSALVARAGEMPEIARIVLGSTLAHINTLTHYFGADAARWQGVLAALVGLAHAWFWWQAWRSRWTLAAFHAVSIMLLFYGLMAGIIVSRLPDHGVNYLHEPRYAVFYLLSNVALILMVIGRERAECHSADVKLERGTAMVALALVAVLQVPLSWFTWHDGAYLSRYYHAMAAQMYALGDGKRGISCVPLLTVCQMPDAEQARLLGFLERHRLNVYSPDFVQRYRLQELVPADEPGQ